VRRIDGGLPDDPVETNLEPAADLQPHLGLNSIAPCRGFEDVL
jgi:hypothetical protein